MFARKRIGFFSILLVVLSVWVSAVVLAQDDAPACEGEYLESVRELGTIYIRSLNAGDLDPWYDVLADDYVAGYSDAGFAPMDKDAARAADEALMAALPGFQTEIHFSTVSADCRTVTFHWTSTGTFSGPLAGIEPTGQTGQVSGISVVEVAGGKIKRELVAYDLMTFLTSVGAMGGETADASGLTEEVAADFVERFDAIFNADLDIADELFAQEFVSHLPLAPELDLEGWKNYVALFQASFPDIRQTTNIMFHSGDMLVVHVTYDGTFSGAPFFGAEPTGAPISMNGIGIFQFVDGKAVENFAVVDVASVLAQTGAWVPPAAEE